MKRHVIEREPPKIGTADREAADREAAEPAPPPAGSG